MEEIKPKLSGTECYFLIALALIADLANLLLVWVFLDWALSLLMTGIFQLYFLIKGLKGKKWSLIGNTIDAIPALSILPAITGGVVGTIIADRRWAKRQNKLAKANPAKEDDLGYNYRETDEDVENMETQDSRKLLNTETPESVRKNSTPTNRDNEQNESPAFAPKPVLNSKIESEAEPVVAPEPIARMRREGTSRMVENPISLPEGYGGRPFYNASSDYENEELSDPYDLARQENHNARVDLRRKHEKEIKEWIEFHNSKRYKLNVRDKGEEEAARLNKELANIKKRHQEDIDYLMNAQKFNYYSKKKAA
ncbi:MAG: hypothetical protein EXS49_02000 [Candidatus Pacebacteria bacterium]|nr:hypothetical protein [Candidatus Paceibacterota bacterium]